MYGTTQHPTLLHTAKHNTFTIAFSVLHSRLILHRYIFYQFSAKFHADGLEPQHSTKFKKKSI